MNFWVNIRYWLLLGSCKLVGLLPFWFLYYVLLDMIYFFVYKVFSYRVKVVRENLTKSFPERTTEELRDIERGFYRHLSEVFIDTIDLSSISQKALTRRMIFEEVYEHEKKLNGGSWLAAMAHYGSWESISAYQVYTKAMLSAAYRPLKDKVFDKYYIYIRSRFGAEPVAMNNVLRYIVGKQRANESFLMCLIADQNPPRQAEPIWHDFLNQKSQFFSGTEKMAMKFKLPVYYVDMEKKSRAHYVVHLEQIYDGEESVEHGEITERYVRALERTIVAEPRYWMWSHRRWKHKYVEKTQE